MYDELAMQILLSSTRRIGISSIGRGDLNRQLSEIGVRVPEQVNELKIYCSSPNLIEMHLEPVVRQRISETSDVEVDDEAVRAGLREVQHRLSGELYFSSSSSLIDIRNSIAVILANSLPGDSTKSPRI